MFEFITIIPDDGTDKGGGWQEANSILPIVNVPKAATICRLHVGMPLRTEFMGVISPDTAALYTSKVANAAVDALKDEWLTPGVYCSRFLTEIEKAFKSRYPKLGAKRMP